MVYLVYATLLIFYIGLIVFNKYKKTWKFKRFVVEYKKDLFFCLYEWSGFIVNVASSIFTAGLIGFFIPIKGVTYKTLLPVMLFGIIFGFIGIKIRKRKKNG